MAGKQRIGPQADGQPGTGALSILDRGTACWMEMAGRWPRSAIAVLGVLVVLAALAVPRITINADSSKLFAADLPSQQRQARLDAAFPAFSSAILIVVRAPQADMADLAVEALAGRLNGDQPAIEAVLAPAINPFLTGHGFMYGSLEEAGELFSRLSESANLIARLRTDQTAGGFLGTVGAATTLATKADMGLDGLAPLYAEAAEVFAAHAAGQQRLFGWTSLTGQQAAGAVTRVITVTPRLDMAQLSPAGAALEAVNAAIADLPPTLTAGVTIGVTGEPALRAGEMDSVFGTIGLSAALSLLLVAMLLRMSMGTMGRSALAMGSLITSLILTTGFAAVTIGTLNVISVAFIVLMVGMGVDFAIHILAHIAEMRREGASPTEAVRQTGARTGLALSLSAGTTALAFLSFSVTDFTGMAQLGVIGAGGTIIAFLTAATLIPAVIAFLPGLAGAPEPRPTGRAGKWRWPTLPRLVAPGMVAPCLVLALGAAAIWPATHVRFEADPMAMRSPDAPSVRAFRMLTESLRTTPYRASVLAPSAEAAAEIAARFQDVPGIGRAMTIGDLVPADQDEKLFLLDIAAPSIQHAISGQPTMLIDDAKGSPLENLQERLEGQPGAAGRLAEALAAYAAIRTPATDKALAGDLFRTFPLMLDRLEAMLKAGPITEVDLPAALRARFVSPDGTYRVAVLPADNLDTPADVAAFAETVQRLAPQATGGPVQIEAAGRTVAQSVLLATLLSALATALLAWFATRRLLDTAAILLPLVIAGIITAAASVLLGMPFNYANVIVLPLMLGMGVDSGIHVALRARRVPGTVFATSTPLAVLFSALTTIAAFGTLALSAHRGTASMGILLSIALLAAVGAVLGLTPAMMRGMARRGERQPGITISRPGAGNGIRQTGET